MKSVGYWQYASNCWFNSKEQDIDSEYLFEEQNIESEYLFEEPESKKKGWFVKLLATLGFLTGIFFVATEIKSKKKQKVYYKIVDSE